MSALTLYVVCFVPEALLQAVVIAMATYEQWFCSDKSDPMKQVLFCDSGIVGIVSSSCSVSLVMCPSSS